MYDVFLSYRRATGLEFCSFLKKTLTERGYQVFVDFDSMRRGDFPDQISVAISECTYFLLALAPHDLDACLLEPETDWVLREIGIAKELGKVIIPVQFKEGFSFPEGYGSNEILSFLQRQQICDIHGKDIAQLVETRLFEFMGQSPASAMTEEYYSGIAQEDYLQWECSSLSKIYGDCEFVNEFDMLYPAMVLEGSPHVTFPFDALNRLDNLRKAESPLERPGFALLEDFGKIIEPKVQFPNLYGFANEGLLFDDGGMVEGFIARPHIYRETLYTSHVLRYELWRAYRRMGPLVNATLDDLPIRKSYHAGMTNREALFSPRGRSALCGINLATLVLNERDGCYEIALAKRSRSVSSYPGCLSIVPTGGFELYELEESQGEAIVRKNFSILAAILREYTEELFGEEEFDEPTGNDDLNRLYRNKHVRELLSGVEKGTYHFEFIGVVLDVIHMRPEFSFVLRIDDPKFFFENDIQRNRENVNVRFVPLPSVEEYIREMNGVPVMPISAGAYSLLKRNHLYIEAMRA